MHSNVLPFNSVRKMAPLKSERYHRENVTNDHRKSNSNDDDNRDNEEMYKHPTASVTVFIKLQNTFS